MLLADPFSFPADAFLDGLADEAPGAHRLGGLASAARGPGGNRLVLDGAIHDRRRRRRAAARRRSTATAVVSQGCRPIGEPMVVTRAEGNLIDELASEPALQRLLRLVESLDARRPRPGRPRAPPRPRHRRAQGRFEPGDFLIRNVLGADREREAVAVGDEVEVGTTVQFQVRDADVRRRGPARAARPVSDADGALVFTCNGRGTHLFGVPDHDAALVAAVAGGATAGMFCAGELGPVGGRPFLHGFTASVLLFDR